MDISWLRNLNRRSMFWRYQEERDRLRPPPVSPRRGHPRHSSSGGGTDRCRQRSDSVATPTSISTPIDIPTQRHSATTRSVLVGGGSGEPGGGLSSSAAAEPTVILIGGRSSSSRRSCSSDRRHRRRRDRPRNRHTSLTDHGRGGRIVPASSSSASPCNRDQQNHHNQDHRARTSHQHLRVPGVGGGMGNSRRHRRHSRSRSPEEEARRNGGGRGGGGAGDGRRESSELPSYDDVITGTNSPLSSASSRFPFVEGKTSWESFPPPPTYQEAVCSLGGLNSPTDARWHVPAEEVGGDGGGGGGGGGNWIRTPPEVIIIRSPTDSMTQPTG